MAVRRVPLSELVPFLHNAAMRQTVLRLFQHLVKESEDSSSGADMTVLIETVETASKTDYVLRRDILMALRRMLMRSPLAIRTFKDHGGFMCVLAVLISLENSAWRSLRCFTRFLFVQLHDRCCCSIPPFSPFLVLCLVMGLTMCVWQASATMPKIFRCGLGCWIYHCAHCTQHSPSRRALNTLWNTSVRVVSNLL